MVDRPRRLIARHLVAVDAVLALGLLIVGEAAVLSARRGEIHSVSTAIAVVLVAAAVAVRRPSPAVAAGLLLTAVVVDKATGGNLSRTGVGWAAILLVGYTAGAHAGRREGPLALGLLLATMTIVYVSVVGQKGTAPSEWLWELALAAAPYGVGRLLRARRRLHAELEDRALALTHEREQRERLAISEERARIARELHDVAAHSLSLMVVQAGAARSVLDVAPGAAAEALEAVAATGRQTMTELDRLLGFLETDDASSLGGISRVGDLVAQARQAGLPVEVRITGTARRLPGQLDLVAYRIVQEGLTNALKHAGGAPTQVLVAYDDAVVRVEVSDDGHPRIRHPLAATGASQGLQGMQERVAMAGGELTAGRRPDGGWSVAARLPLDDEANPVGGVPARVAV
jgi:signal transduction histidine kinase